MSTGVPVPEGVDEPIVVVPTGVDREPRETTVEALAPDGGR